MARLRIRIELNRGGAGVPLHKLASVVEEAQKFFHMLAEDVRLEKVKGKVKGKGEWLGFDFDHESLNFTAEYVGPVTPEQVQAFYAAFDGSTSMRRGTIGQFARIADAIGEDELIGFGLYPVQEGAEQAAEPSEWRCLSRRDALRIADEIRLLGAAEGENESEQESRLPVVADHSEGVRLFQERAHRSAGENKLADTMRGVEAALSERMARLENDVEGQAGQIHDLRSRSAATEESFRNLLTAVEGFCDQATRQLERASPKALPAPAATAPGFVTNWRPVILSAATTVLVVALISVSLMLWPSRSEESPRESVSAAAPTGAPPAPGLQPVSPTASTPAASPLAAKPEAKPPTPKRTPVAVTAPANGGPAMKVELEASELAWVSVTTAAGKSLISRALQAGETLVLDLPEDAVLRTGNAGGLIIRFNGQSIGTIGPRGKVRDVEFKGGSYKVGSGAQ